jgi:hypothetical protein
MFLGFNTITKERYFIGINADNELILNDEGYNPKNLIKTKVNNIEKESKTNDFYIKKVNNKISIWINKKLIINEKEINSFYGNNFGFIINSSNSPLKIAFSEFSFETIY